MGYASVDEMISEITIAGKFMRSDWNKLSHPVTAALAGEWSSLFQSAGSPAAGVLNGGTNKSFQTLNDQVAGALVLGGDVAPDTKHVLGASAGSAAGTTAPAVLMLVDMLGYYPLSTTTTTGDQPTVHADTFTADNTTDICTNTAAYDLATFTRVRLTTTGTLPAGLALATDYWTIKLSATTFKLATSFANAVAGVAIDITSVGSGVHTLTSGLPRYTDGAGVQAFSVVSTVMGAATPSFRLTYTNQAGAAGKLTPATLPLMKTAAAVGLVPYSGTGAGKYGPFIPRAAADSGIRSIEQLNLSVSYVSGAFATVLCRPLLAIPTAAVGVWQERDLVNQLPSMPRVFDGACLSWLLMNGAATPANSGFSGHLDLGWG